MCAPILPSIPIVREPDDIPPVGGLGRRSWVLAWPSCLFVCWLALAKLLQKIRVVPTPGSQSGCCQSTAPVTGAAATAVVAAASGAAAQKDDRGEQRSLVVRKLSGEVVSELSGIGDRTPVDDIIRRVSKTANCREDELRLMVGASPLQIGSCLGDCLGYGHQDSTLEVAMLLVPGPSVLAMSASKSKIDVLEGIPQMRTRCQYDRDYVFVSLGDFAEAPGMRYVMTCNDDRKTPSHEVMWQLDLRVAAKVYINFRSQRHVEATGAKTWLKAGGWTHLPEFQSSVTSGYPNGPYSGPIYCKAVNPQNRKFILDLMGSNCWEGTYFVFVQLVPEAEP